MKLEHSFHVDDDVDAAWDVLNDVRRTALCMPGAAVDTVDGDDITGRCKVKLGPITLTYRGQATFIERDAAAHRIVLEGQGQDGSNGRASITVVANLTADGGRTRVDLETDLKLTGKPAQFGRGVMADVSDRLIGQFADALAQQLAADQPTSGELEPSSEGDLAPAEPLDLLAVASDAVARRSAVVAASLVCALLLVIGTRRASQRRSRRRQH
ncbi:carbon monoxide dehydrogenase [Nocardioides immobilis]|uniref:Carbon monoxide dehydrogenase n=1 Tax=Nocardioides immobilis TaxID=2049295 RepID=A0A417Y170_9ACTN|nr:SRPBCC family protein [Nocardioides immobilis]RHW26345.1 carbon monoxide dehydrogenase [Nocardioides immobilis]